MALKTISLFGTRLKGFDMGSIPVFRSISTHGIRLFNSSVY